MEDSALGRGTVLYRDLRHEKKAQAGGEQEQKFSILAAVRLNKQQARKYKTKLSPGPTPSQSDLIGLCVVGEGP